MQKKILTGYERILKWNFKQKQYFLRLIILMWHKQSTVFNQIIPCLDLTDQ